MIILQILGGIVVAVLLFFLVVYIYNRIKYGKYLDLDTNQEPLAIHLNEELSPEWLEYNQPQQAIQELGELGFATGKPYSIFEMSGYQLHSFFKDSIVAVVYWHDVIGCWVDMVAEEVNGKEFTFSNAPMGSGIDTRPECEKKFRLFSFS